MTEERTSRLSHRTERVQTAGPPPPPVLRPAMRRRRHPLAWAVAVVIVALLVAGGALAVIEIHRHDGPAPTRFQLQARTLQDVQRQISGVVRVDCVMPSSWTAGQIFTCFAYGSAGTELAQLHGTVLPDTGSTWMINEDWVPTVAARPATPRSKPIASTTTTTVPATPLTPTAGIATLETGHIAASRACFALNGFEGSTEAAMASGGGASLGVYVTPTFSTAVTAVAALADAKAITTRLYAAIGVGATMIYNDIAPAAADLTFPPDHPAGAIWTLAMALAALQHACTDAGLHVSPAPASGTTPAPWLTGAMVVP